MLMRPIKPEVASIMGMALVGDLDDTSIGDEGFRGLGIEPRGARAFIARATHVPA
jgi:hypothetical protein